MPKITTPSELQFFTAAWSNTGTRDCAVSTLDMSKIQLDMALSKVLTLPEQGVGPGDPNLNDSVINSILVLCHFV